MVFHKEAYIDRQEICIEKKNLKRKKPTSFKVDYQYRNDDYTNIGLIPAMLGLVALLPKDWQPYGERIVAILTIAIIAMFALFIIGVIAPSLSGSNYQIADYCNLGIYGVAIAAVGAIVLTFKQKIA